MSSFVPSPITQPFIEIETSPKILEKIFEKNSRKFLTKKSRKILDFFLKMQKRKKCKKEQKCKKKRKKRKNWSLEKKEKNVKKVKKMQKKQLKFGHHYSTCSLL